MRNFYPREETGVGGIQTGCKQSGKIGIRQVYCLCRFSQGRILYIAALNVMDCIYSGKMSFFQNDIILGRKRLSA